MKTSSYIEKIQSLDSWAIEINNWNCHVVVETIENITLVLVSDLILRWNHNLEKKMKKTSLRKFENSENFNLKLAGRVEISMYKMRMLNISFSRPLFVVVFQLWTDMRSPWQKKISKSDVAHIKRIGRTPLTSLSPSGYSAEKLTR